MKNEDYMLTIKNLVNGSSLNEDDKYRLLKYTEYLIQYESENNLGKAYGYLKKQYKMLEIENNTLKREIEEMKNVF